MGNSTPFGFDRGMWLLLLIILLGAALRFYGLGTQSLWYDEAFSRATAERLSLGQLVTNQGQDIHPPLYYLLLRFWIKAVGANDFTARMPSLLAGMLTIPLMHVIGRKLFDPKTGLWSALFIAVFPFHVYYAQEARMYTLLALLAALSLWFFLQGIEQNQRSTWAAFWVCLLLGIYTHYFFAFIIFAYHLYLILNWKKHRHVWLPVVMVDGLLILALSVQAAVLIRKLATVMGPSYWLGRPNPLTFFTTIYFFVVSYTVPPWLNAIGLFIVIGILAVGLYEQLRNTKLAPYVQERVFLSLGAFLPILIVLAISQVKPVFLERTLTACTPFLTLLLADRVRTSRWRSPMPYLSIALGVLVIVSLYRYYFDPSTRKPALREAASQIATAFKPGDIVLHTSVGSFMPFLFYDPPSEHYLLWGDPDPHLPASAYESFGARIISRDAIADKCRVWLVVLLDHSVDYQRGQVDWFDNHYKLAEDLNVGGIPVRLYDCAEDMAVGGRSP